MMENENKKIWQSYVWHEDKCFFVSTIIREFSTYEGPTQGEETLTWEYDYEKGERGQWIGQSGGILDHQAICRCLISFGEIPDTDDERYQRFRNPSKVTS
jgi:hypothetical protein